MLEDKPLKFAIWLHRLTWISRAVTRTMLEDKPLKFAIWLHRLTWISRSQAAMLEDKPLKFAIWLHRLTWLSRAVTFDCTDWPGYPGHKQPCWRTNHLSLPFDCTDWPGYPGAQAAMLEDKPLKFAIWLHRLTWLSRAVTFDCTDWPGYPGHKQPCWRTNHLSLPFDCTDWPGYPGHKQPCWRTNHLSLPFDCTDWPGYPGQSHLIAQTDWISRSQAAMLEDKPLKFAIWLHRLTWISRAVMRTQSSCEPQKKITKRSSYAQ